ncbi:MAG: NADH-quinone oxidoreductase subunit L [Tetrasphaera sp.]
MIAGALLALAIGLLLGGGGLTLLVGHARPRLAATVAVVAGVAAAGVGVAAALGKQGPWRAPVLWPDLPGLNVGGQIVGTPVTDAIALTVLLVTLAVQIFAAWYLAGDDRYASFAATVGLFAAAMLLLVTSRDLVHLLVGWEVMGWCSYLLIGHWSRKATARRAALKAFLVTRLADAGFVIGIVVLAATYQTTDLDLILTLATDPSFGQTCTTCASPPNATVAFALAALVVGVLGKSAQIPFQDWLTDAMEGPTPASALIHAATMVAAGTWVLAQLAPLLTYAAAAQWILALSVAATMVLAGFAAFLQTDLKRLLAWSTISQIAVMLAPLAAAPAAAHFRLPSPAAHPEPAAEAAIGHLYGHAIFKALLFLTVGWLSVAAGSTAARALRGSGRAHLLARLAWGIGLASLAGVPLTVGGFSKEHVIDVAAWVDTEPGPGLRQGIVTVALLLTVALTAAYAARAYAVVASGPAEAGSHASGPDGGVRLVLGLLTLACLAGSAIFFLGPLSAGHFSVLVLGLSVALILLGATIGWRWRPDDDLEPTAWMRAASAGFGADGAYLSLVARPVLALARAVAYLDREVVDIYVRAAAVGTRGVGALGARAHERERIATTLVWVLLGLLALAGVAWWV